MAKLAKTLGAVALAGFTAGAAALSYGAFIEAKWFKIRFEELPVLPAGAEPIRILHVADHHLVPRDKAKIAFTRKLAELSPDVVVNTGDNLGGKDSLDPLMEAMEPLFEFPGVFVPGSNDFYGPKRTNPLKYFSGPSTEHSTKDMAADRDELPWLQLFGRFQQAGWVPLANRGHRMEIKGSSVEWVGTGDAHLGMEKLMQFSKNPEVEPTVRIAATHAPYQRVLNQLTAAGADVVFAGHTHGGQIAMPFYGALVTNCDLPTRYASGFFDWSWAGKTAKVNISAGIGASPAVPVRFACRPEAVVIDLLPAELGRS